MEIRREKKFYGFRWQDADEYLALVILEDGTQVQQHRNKTHIGQLAVVTDTHASNSSHQVAA